MPAETMVMPKGVFWGKRRSVSTGESGRGAAHAKKKMLSSTKVPGGKADACFVVKGLAENDVLCGECNSRADAVALKDALNALLRCAARWPNRLASG